MNGPTIPPPRRISRTRALAAPILVAVALAGLWWQSQGARFFSKGSGVALDSGPHAAALSGEWFGRITYPEGAAHIERFMFHAESDRLYGTASVLGLGRAVEEGKIEGNRIYFSVRYQEIAGDAAVERKNHYAGALGAGELRMRLQDDKGNPPVDFQLGRTEAKREVN